MGQAEPRILERSDLSRAVSYAASIVKAPAIGQLLGAADCADPAPQQGKRKRLRAAFEATQQRDGHAGAVVRFIESVRGAEDAEERRAAVLRAAYRRGSTSPRAKVRALGGFSFEVGVGYGAREPCLSIALLPDCESTPVYLERQQVLELEQALREVSSELARRREGT